MCFFAGLFCVNFSILTFVLNILSENKKYAMTNLSIFLFTMGGYEWVLILLAVLLLFGGKKIPELMRGLGSGIKEFKNASKEEKQNKKDE